MSSAFYDAAKAFFDNLVADPDEKDPIDLRSQAMGGLANIARAHGLSYEQAVGETCRFMATIACNAQLKRLVELSKDMVEWMAEQQTFPPDHIAAVRKAMFALFTKHKRMTDEAAAEVEAAQAKRN